MSFPTIPNITPSINITTEETVNLLLASIAFEELGLAHIINAEAEKIQFILGTLSSQGASSVPPTLEELMAIDTSVEHTLREVIKSQMLLQFKLEDIVKIPTSSTTTSTTTSTSSSTTTSKSTSTCTTTCDC